MLANQVRLLQNFALLLQIFARLLQIVALLLQIFAFLLQIFALLSLLFGINCTEIDQSHSSIISIYIIIPVSVLLLPILVLYQYISNVICVPLILVF